MATLRDVAARAGVSVGAVSRILKGNGGIVVRPDTRRRVLEAVQELSYRPNRLATGLRTRRAGSIALFLPEPQNPGWADMLGAIQAETARVDNLLAIADVRGPALDPTVFARYALEARVDGVLLATGMLHERLVRRLAESGLPLLPVGSRYRSLAASVTMRDADASAMAVEHLVGLGHRRVAFLSGIAGTDIVRRREVGFMEAMRALGLRGMRFPTHGTGGTLEDSRAAAVELLSRPGRQRPTAAVAINLMSALGLRGAAVGLGLRIPDDLAIVAFDDHVVAEHTDPPLTTLWMPMAEMGAQAVRMLLASLDGGALEHRVISTAPRLVVRASTAGRG